MIKEILQQAILQIEIERDQKIETVKNTIMQDKIAPHNMEIDMSRDNALNELSEKREKEFAEINTKYEAERQAIIDASEKNKTDNANSIIARETYGISVEYEKVLSELRKQIEVKE